MYRRSAHSKNRVQFSGRHGTPCRAMELLESRMVLAGNIVSGLDLVSVSDTGRFDNDNVTSIRQPVFVGSAPVNTQVQLRANNIVVGTAVAGADSRWQIQSASLDDGIFEFTVACLDEEGVPIPSNQSLFVEIDSTVPNSPYLDVIRESDRGFRDDDNITNDDTLTVSMTTEDPGQAGRFNIFNYIFRVYARPEDAALGVTGNEVLVYDSSTDLSIPLADRFNGFTRNELLQRTLAALPDGIHNLKLEVEDRAGNISEDFLLNASIDSRIPLAALDLIADSDTGANDSDNVTRITTPTFVGTSVAGSRVRLFADGVQVGQSVVGADATNGVLLDGIGQWQVTSSSLSDGVHSFVVSIETEAGNVAESAPLLVDIDSTVPNTPYLDLVRDSDRGLRDDDNITNDTTLTLSMTSQDPGQAGRFNSFNYIFRVFVRPEGTPLGAAGNEILVYDSSTDASIPVADLQGGYTRSELLQTTLAALPSGVHNFKLEVEDRAGNISDDFLLTVTIDARLPVATLEMIAESDTGISDTDNVTNIPIPTFVGNSVVGARVRLIANGQQVGEAVVGADSTDGVAGNGLGQWRATSSALRDRVHGFLVAIETEAGSVAESTELQVEVDTTVPNTPYLDLVTASDTGLNQYDNITTDRTPTFTMTTVDPRQLEHLTRFNYIFRLFLRSEETGLGESRERLIYDSSVDATIPVGNTSGGLTNLEVLQRTIAEIGVGMHNFKLEVEDRAGNISDDFLLNVLIANVGAAEVVTIDLVDASDTGMSNTDNVTKIITPTFSGTAAVGSEIFLLADGQLIGKGFVASDDSDGVIGNGRGVWFASTQSLTDGVYSVVARAENLAGAVSLSNAIVVEIDTLAPNTPLLDLTAASDSGRHDADNITNDTTLTVTMTTEDRVAAEPHLFAHNFKFRLFVRPEATSVGVTGEELLIYESAVDATIPAANLLDMFTNLSFLQRTLGALPHGVHHFKLEVEDRAGNISEDFLLPIEIDTVAPQGSLDLDPNSDSGVTAILSTQSDRITRDTTPSLKGSTEADAIVRITIDGVPAGTTVATPLDGNDAFPPPAGFTGNFQLESGIHLADGEHSIQLFVEDRAGNGRNIRAATLTVFVDTQGPQVTNVVMGNVSQDGVFRRDGLSSVFAPKPASGPDDLVSSIIVNFQDLPVRTPGFLYDAIVAQLLSNVGNYTLVGDATGSIPILEARPTFTTVAGLRAVARVELIFHDPVDAILFNGNDRGTPLPDDRFTLTLSDQLSDAAGNALDGESNAAAPFTGSDGNLASPPNLPSGDGVPGGSFTARFTIDSRPEIGVWAAGSVWVDINGNFVFDAQNADASHRDIVFKTGFTSDDIFAGNFRAPGAAVTDGFDKLAAYGRYRGAYRWIVDFDHDGAADLHIVDPANVNGLPIAGNFNGIAADGDEVAVFTGSSWHFDTNGDYRVDTSLATTMRGYPVVGDFDGDGFDDLATWADDRFQIDLANGAARGWDGTADHAFRFGFIGVRERPISADMDGDGFDDLGLWVPDRVGVAPREAGEWYILVSGGASIINRIEPALNPIRGLPEVRFSPVPFGNDVFAQFGDQFALPVVGNFDPPVSNVAPPPKQFGHTNLINELDVNNDTYVSAIDALLIIHEINARGSREMKVQGSGAQYIDVNGDGFVSAIDVLLVINYLNQQSAAAAAAASAVVPSRAPAPKPSSVPDHLATMARSASQDTFDSAVLPTGHEWVSDNFDRRKIRAVRTAIDAVFAENWK
ncbi:MAG: Ig-like domain-containing protein [Planctomycetota bacterium]|nr:Ig-like domain-containing protein [Planctomycetota bacterium]